MDDKQHLYNLIQGNKNPFKTDTASAASSTQTQPEKKSASTQAEVLSDIEKLKEMFKTPPETPEKAIFRGYKPKPAFTPPPSYHTRERKKPDQAHLNVFESIPRRKPIPRPTPLPESVPRTRPPTPYTSSTPHRKTSFKVPRRLVTGVIDWYNA